MARRLAEFRDLICITEYRACMTMVSFRADDADVAAAEHWARRLGVDRSELLRDALRRHLAELAADYDLAAYAERPLSPEETSLADIADWGPAEEWSDWADATG